MYVYLYEFFVLHFLSSFQSIIFGSLLRIFGSVTLNFLYRFVFNHENCITLVAYIPRRYRSVILLSSSHPTPSIDDSTEDSRKPAMVTDYNRTKGEVDLMDECVETFTCRRKTTRWPLLLYFNLLDVAANNAFLLMMRNGYSGDRAAFIRALTMQLATPNMLRRLELQRVSSSSKRCIRSLLNLSTVPSSTPSAPSRNPGYCHMCRKSSRSKCDICGQFCCKPHAHVEKITRCSDCL